MSGQILNIFVGSTVETPMNSVDSVELVAGKGVVGDRYFNQEGGTWTKIYPKPDRQVSIINISVIQAFKKKYGIELKPIDLRRNILVDVPFLKPFMFHKFFLGDAILCTSRYSHPCKMLENKLQKNNLIEICKKEVWSFGINCQILKGGFIKVGDYMRLPETDKDNQLINDDLVNKPQLFNNDRFDNKWLN